MNDPLKEAARLYANRDYPATEAVCRTVLLNDPHHFDTLHLLGVVLTTQERLEEAVTMLRRAEAEQPAHALLRVNLGNALLAMKRYEDAVAVSLGGGAADLNNLGLAYRGLGQLDAAVSSFRQAIEARWDHAAAWFNLATTLVRLDRLEEALLAARSTLRVAPLDTPVRRLADITNATGQVLMGLGRPEEALAICRDFLRRHPEQKTVVWNMSLCLLLLGRFDEGWPAYEFRFDVPENDARPVDAVVLDPAHVAGKRVLILTEQGRGDMLQFIRYVPLLQERGATVAIQAYPDLVPLLAAMPGVVTVVSVDDPRPPADLVTPVMSLPLAFGSHPARVPYLRVPPDRQTAWLGRRTRRRVGIAWSGSSQSHGRSAMPAEALAPLLTLPHLEFHCLQKEIIDSDRAWLEAVAPPVMVHTSRLSDFADTAGLIAQMDLVISIDTAVAHLAGALAKPVWLMLPFNPDWRWMLGREDSPWYPTARLFRQPRRGAWLPVVEAVIAALRPV